MDCSDFQIITPYFLYFDYSPLFNDIMAFPHLTQQKFSVRMQDDFQLTEKADLSKEKILYFHANVLLLLLLRRVPNRNLISSLELMPEHWLNFFSS